MAKLVRMVLDYGSLSLTDEPVRTATMSAIEAAEKAGAWISFDPNLREPLWESLEEAKKQNLHSIYLEVRVSNIAAVTLYEHAGFKEVGQRKNYYDNPREDARLMLWEA